MRAVTFASTAFALGLLAARIHSSGSYAFSFLAWNLLLAWVPLVVSTLLAKIARGRRLPVVVLVGALATWLLFFPNAPYVITDFVHLHQRASAPLWFDIALLTSFAWAAGLCAVVSLRQVHGLIRARSGSDVVAWSFVVVTALLTGFGIYLGRFDRWNSWDVVTRPRALLAGVIDILRDPTPRVVGVTLVFAVLWLLVYTATRAGARVRAEQRAQ